MAAAAAVVVPLFSSRYLAPGGAGHAMSGAGVCLRGVCVVCVCARARAYDHAAPGAFAGASVWADLPIHMHLAESFLPTGLNGGPAALSWWPWPGDGLASPLFAGAALAYPYIPGAVQLCPCAVCGHRVLLSCVLRVVV